MGAPATTAGRLPATGVARDSRALAESIDGKIVRSQLLAQGIGALDVALLLFFVLPWPQDLPDREEIMLLNAVTCAIVWPLGALVGVYFGRKLSAARMAWVREGRAPTAAERSAILRMPNKCFKLDVAMWLTGALIFFVVNATLSLEAAAHIAWTLILGGLTTCAIAFLLLERQLRPITELALESGPPGGRVWPGVEGRLVLAWLLGTGMPMLGITSVGLGALTDPLPPDEVARAIFVLGVMGIAIGLGTMYVVARTVSVPLTSVRKALGRVQAGDLATEVRVDDASEVGMLQSGFNSMVGGLRERERMQDLYAKQVGEEVARAALADEPRLGGEEREVAVLFVDIIGSTALAAQAPPERVVARLNRFFAVVVEVVAAHGGWVNKFEGDAALAVFGAPADQEDPAGCALAAGRELRLRLARDVPGVDAGIGLSAGPAVAGWVGAVQRFEYTVIGDPVNVASRLCELAKQRPERLVASEAIVRRAGAEERGQWSLGESEVLRGRTQPTRLAAPAGSLVAQ